MRKRTQLFALNLVLSALLMMGLPLAALAAEAAEPLPDDPALEEVSEAEAEDEQEAAAVADAVVADENLAGGGHSEEGLPEDEVVPSDEELLQDETPVAEPEEESAATEGEVLGVADDDVVTPEVADEALSEEAEAVAEEESAEALPVAAPRMLASRALAAAAAPVATGPIADGTYVIHSLLAGTQVVDASLKAGAISSWSSNTGKNQYFNLSFDAAKGAYAISSAYNNKYLNADTTGGKQVYLADALSYWTIEAKGDGYLIRSTTNGQVLDIRRSSTQNGAQIILYSENSSATNNQLYELIAAPSLAPATEAPAEGYYYLTNSSDKVMDVSRANDATGTSVLTYTRNSTPQPNQIFRIEVTEDNFVHILAGDGYRAVSSGANLVGSSSNKATLATPSDTALNQLYRAEKQSDGTWAFFNVATGERLGSTKSPVTTGASGNWTLKPAGNMLREGLYEINLVGTSRRLDVAGASLSANARVFQYDRGTGQNQKWDIVRVGANRYTIQCVRSGLYLSFGSNGAVQSSKPVVFEARPLISGWGLVDTSTGRALDVSHASTENRASVISYRYNRGAAQRFNFTSTAPLANGTYAIELTTNRNLVVSVASETLSAKTNVEMQKWAGAKQDNAGNQKWIFTRNSDGTYTIRDAYSGLALDAAGATPRSGANVSQYGNNNGANQKWRLVYNHDGSFDIVNVANPNVVLTAAGAAAGKNVSVATDTNAATQHFAFKPTSYTSSISGNAELDRILREMIAKYGTGRDGLWKAYVDVGNYTYKTMNTYPSGTWRSWSIPYAIEMYKNKTGNCYRYASLMCWFARALGYDARTVSGQILVANGYVAHGWAEVRMNGQRLVLDAREGWAMEAWYGRSRSSCFLVTYEKYPFYYKIVSSDY